MAFFRQYIAPFLIVLVFLVALVAVSARNFLPGDMAQQAPVEEELVPPHPTATLGPEATSAVAFPNLSILVKGLPEDPAIAPL